MFLFRVALAGIAAVAVSSLGWISVAPNRLLPGTGIPATAVFGIAVPPLALAPLGAAFLAGRGRAASWAALALALATLALALLGTGEAARGLLPDPAGFARVRLGAAFWITTAVLVALALEAAREADRRAPAATTLGIVLALGFAAKAGLFEALSLAAELKTNNPLDR